MHQHAQLCNLGQTSTVQDPTEAFSMGKTPREIEGFIALPLSLPATHQFQRDATHYLYLKQHEPDVPDEDTSRSLFLVNVPITATEQSFRHLFATQLEGGRLEQVIFAETEPEKHFVHTPSSRKRKRMTAEEIEAGLSTHTLPETFDSRIHKGGATAIAVFVDRPSLELTVKAAKRAAKQAKPIHWDAVQEETCPRLGLSRYRHHNSLQFPSNKSLLRSVNAYMTAYTQLEETRSKEAARKRQMPDEDGFVTVTRGSKGSARMDEARDVAEKQTAKGKGLEDFYRFQTREKRKEQHSEMLRKFEEDKKKVEEMRKRRRTLQT